MKFVLALFVFLFPSAASAHVEYVLTDAEMAQYSGLDWGFFVSGLLDTTALALVAVSLVVLVIGYMLLHKTALIHDGRAHIVSRRKVYEQYIPWMARLGLGIALIGAGTSQALLNPAFDTTALVASFEIFVGFMLLAGFLLTPMIWIVVLFFLVALILDPYAIGSLDVLVLALVFMMHSEPSPGVDDLLEIPFVASLKKFHQYAPLVLRLGLGVAMMYLALVEKVLNPHTAALVVEAYQLTSVVPVSAAAWVAWAGVVEFLIGLALLIGWRVRFVSMVAFLVLSLSFFYFGEEVYSHITLFTVLSMLFVVGSGDGNVKKPKKKK